MKATAMVRKGEISVEEAKRSSEDHLKKETKAATGPKKQTLNQSWTEKECS